MKPSFHHKTVVQLLAFPALCAALLSLLTGCDRVDPPPATMDVATTVTPIQQEPGDLLGGVKKAVCYSGFRSGQHPDRGDGAVNPSDEEVLEDLQILSRNGNFRLIRLYDSQVNSEAVLRLIKANDLDIKVVLGAWLDAEINNPACPWHPQPYPDEVLEANQRKNAEEIDRAIRLANEYPDIVVAVAVGNEALVSWNDHMVPVDSVIRYVRQVKQSIAQPVTVADNYDWWAKHGADLAREVDFVSVHIYPVWEGKDIDEAMAFGTANMQAVRNALPDSQLVITEAGWATVASEFGPRASEARQQRYYHDLFDWTGKMNITTFFFEAFDESWKGDPNNPLRRGKALGAVHRGARAQVGDAGPVSGSRARRERPIERIQKNCGHQGSGFTRSRMGGDRPDQSAEGPGWWSADIFVRAKACTPRASGQECPRSWPGNQNDSVQPRTHEPHERNTEEQQAGGGNLRSADARHHLVCCPPSDKLAFVPSFRVFCVFRG